MSFLLNAYSHNLEDRRLDLFYHPSLSNMYSFDQSSKENKILFGGGGGGVTRNIQKNILGNKKQLTPMRPPVYRYIDITDGGKKLSVISMFLLVVSIIIVVDKYEERAFNYYLSTT